MPYTEILNQMKKKSGLTTQQTSDQTGVPASTITRMLTGETEEPTFSNIAKVVKVWGGSLDELAGIPPKTVTVVETKTVSGDERIIDLYERSIKSKNKWIRNLFIISITLIVFLVGILIYDVTHPDRGWYRDVLQAIGNTDGSNGTSFWEGLKAWASRLF